MNSNVFNLRGPALMDIKETWLSIDGHAVYAV